MSTLLLHPDFSAFAKFLEKRWGISIKDEDREQLLFLESAPNSEPSQPVEFKPDPFHFAANA